MQRQLSGERVVCSTKDAGKHMQTSKQTNPTTKNLDPYLEPYKKLTKNRSLT